MQISAVVLTKNEEEQIKDCLESVKWADEILVIDDGSIDKTLEIVKEYTDKIWIDESEDFSAKRNLGLEKARGDWILYIDADERITPGLQEEIGTRIMNQESGFMAYKLPRKNFYFGSSKKNEWPYVEKIERLFRKDKLRGWHGKLHESPIVEGSVGELQNFFLHYTHRDLSSMIKKTIGWSKTEAELRFRANHPPVYWWRFPRVMLTEFYHSYIKQKGWKVGTIGIIESLYQAFSIFITYARLWEMQNQEKNKIK